MIRSFVTIYCGVIAVAIIAMLATTAWAEELLWNGDVETITRFSPHELDHPNGYPDGWHHSANSAWSNGTTDPAVSPTHSLYIPDESVGDHDEMRSFATAIPGVDALGDRFLDVSWKWNWDITSAAGDMFSATVRTSTQPVSGFDLSGAGPEVRDHLFLTDGTASSGGFQMLMESIPLLASEQSFDIIFRTRDDEGNSSELGVLFVDDISATTNIPEPATMGLLGLSGLALMMVSRRRHS